MKVEDIVKYRGVRLQHTPRDEDGLACVREALVRSGYDEAAVRACVELPDVPALQFLELAGYRWLCLRAASPAATMAALWLLCQRLPAGEVEAILGPAAASELRSRQVLRDQDGLVDAAVDLYPCEGAYVFTDRMFGAARFSQHVYELGKDSYALARMTPRKSVSRTLDLCTGSGIHAILAAGHSERCVGVDLNPRALEFARVNAALNGVAGRCEFHLGDLYQAVAGETFDLITANPPWVPTPDEHMEIYRTGGESGEVLTQRIVAGLPLHLAPGGTLAMFVIYPMVRRSPYLERVRSWLSGGSGWGLALTNFSEIASAGFVRLHISPLADPLSHDREFCRWMDSYEQQQIEKIGLGMLYVRRLSAGRPGWAVEKSMPFPLRTMAPHVEPWLDTLERYHDPDWTVAWNEWKPRLDWHVRLWVDGRTGDGRIEFGDGDWAAPVDLHPDETRLASQLVGRSTAAQLARTWARKQGIDESAARNRIGDLLRSLGQKCVLR